MLDGCPMSFPLIPDLSKNNDGQRSNCWLLLHMIHLNFHLIAPLVACTQLPNIILVLHGWVLMLIPQHEVCLNVLSRTIHIRRWLETLLYILEGDWKPSYSIPWSITYFVIEIWALQSRHHIVVYHISLYCSFITSPGPHCCHFPWPKLLLISFGCMWHHFGRGGANYGRSAAVFDASL